MSMARSTEISGFLDGRKYTASFLYEFCALLVGNGVYANELAPTANNDNMTVTYGSGHGWINGVLYKNTTPFDMEFDTADGALNRYDSIMLRLDLSRNEAYAVVEKGAFASAPIPPDVTRNAETFDLKICDVYIPAGCTKITQAQIIDRRLDSSVCGVPVFPIEHLDMTTFYRQVATDLDNLKKKEQAEILALLEQLNDLVAGDTVGKLIAQINTKLAIDGTTGMTADLPMDGHRVKNMGEPQESSDAANRGYVDGAVKTARAVNLLDNSNFRKPVMQAGPNGKHGTKKYVCDRWISWNADAIFGDGYMTTGSPYDQLIDPAVIDTSATYTAAIGLADGTVIAYSGNFDSGFGYKNSGIYGGVSTSDGVTPFVRIASGQDVCWAALYEGEYTAETLPEYQPKGYAAEMMECMRYYQYFNHSILLPANEEILPGFRFAVEMRAVPTVTLKDKNDTEGCIELWTSAGLTQGNKVKQIVAASYGIRYMALETAPTVNARALYKMEVCADL